MRYSNLIVVRGAGDLATGVIQKLYRAGFHVVALEVENPTTIRTNVALSSAVYDGECTVEDITARLIDNIEQLDRCYKEGRVPVVVDPNCNIINKLNPDCVVDAIIAKKATGTNMSMAPITIALGPGFEAGKDVNAVIETMRGHNLGRLILDGKAIPNTGVPGEIGGKSAQRVIHAPDRGEVVPYYKVGQKIEKGETLLKVGGACMTAPFTGLVRGIIRNGMVVTKGMKIADIDPRLDVDWNTISDKARCLGGAVLEAYLYLKRRIK